MEVYGLLARLAALTALGCSVSLAAAGAADVGATIPWTTYEAESAVTTGRVLGPNYAGNTPAKEASGRRCVRLAGTGDAIEFTATAEAQGLVVRYSIPDTADGRGADATLSLYINGQFKQKLPLTSRYSHLYGAYPFNNQPDTGSPRNFWDEVRTMPGEIRAGDVVRLQKDADDSAAEYLIDFIDLEPVPPPAPRPEGSVSVTDFGAKPNDDADDREAFLAAVAAGKAQRKLVWIPAGNFIIKGAIQLSDIELRGAGMWHSTLVGVDDYKPENRVALYGNGGNITLADFAIFGKLNYRNDAEPNDGIGESFGTGSSIRNIWVEHTKAGAWVVNSDGLVVEGCRFRNTIADGMNLCVGMRNSIVRNCTARGTGDDCFAMWPATYANAAYEHGNNTYSHCTAQLPFLAQAFSIYGGEGNLVENCQAIDIPIGAGLYASTTFPTDSGFKGTTMFRRNRITRAGGTEGAIGTVANRIDLLGVRFEEIDVIDSPADGIKFISLNGRALGDAVFDRIRIVNPGVSGEGAGVVESAGAVGSAIMSNITIVNPKTRAWQDDAPAFNLIRKEGDAGSGTDRQSNEDKPTARSGR